MMHKVSRSQFYEYNRSFQEFGERHVESHYPGYLLCQDTFFVGRLKCVGQIYLQAVVAT